MCASVCYWRFIVLVKRFTGFTFWHYYHINIKRLVASEPLLSTYPDLWNSRKFLLKIPERFNILKLQLFIAKIKITTEQKCISEIELEILASLFIPKLKNVLYILFFTFQFSWTIKRQELFYNTKVIYVIIHSHLIWLQETTQSLANYHFRLNILLLLQ